MLHITWEGHLRIPLNATTANSTDSPEERSFDFSKMPLTKHSVEVLNWTYILCPPEGSIWVKMLIHFHIVKWAGAQVLGTCDWNKRCGMLGWPFFWEQRGPWGPLQLDKGLWTVNSKLLPTMSHRDLNYSKISLAPQASHPNWGVDTRSRRVAWVL